jgi:hypothetical protein
VKRFFHETMSIKSLTFERGVTADNRAYLAPPCYAQIPQRETSDTLVTLCERRCHQFRGGEIHVKKDC